VLLAVLLWRGRRPGAISATVAALSQVVALILFFTVVNPVNTTQAHWTTANPPSDWQHVRDMWEYGHAIRGVLYALAFGFLLATVLSAAHRRAAARTLRERVGAAIR